MLLKIIKRFITVWYSLKYSHADYWAFYLFLYSEVKLWYPWDLHLTQFFPSAIAPACHDPLFFFIVYQFIAKGNNLVIEIGVIQDPSWHFADFKTKNIKWNMTIRFLMKWSLLKAGIYHSILEMYSVNNSVINLSS